MQRFSKTSRSCNLQSRRRNPRLCQPQPEAKPAVAPETPGGKLSAIDESKIDWSNIKQKWGIDKNAIDPKDLTEMLHNRKSKLMTLNADYFGEKFDIDARLSFQTNPDGNVTVKPHFIRTEPDLSQEFCGVKFTKEDKEMLKNTGNLGRVVEITDANGNKIQIVCQH